MCKRFYTLCKWFLNGHFSTRKRDGTRWKKFINASGKLNFQLTPANRNE